VTSLTSKTTPDVQLPAGLFNISALCSRIANREVPRTEADLQSDIKAFLLTAPFALHDAEVHNVLLESPAGQRRRIDIEVGFAVIEVKKDLRRAGVLADAVTQLAGYVKDRTATLQQRYVGVLTDGAVWHLYHLINDELAKVSTFELDSTRPNVERLTIWLEGILATAQQLTPTPTEIERRLGATSTSYDLDFADLLALYRANATHPNVVLKRQLWARLLTTALGTNFVDSDELFVNHSLLVATGELVAHAVLGFKVTEEHPATLLSGKLFHDIQILGVVEADFFDWPLDIVSGDRFIVGLARRLARFNWADVEHDVMKILYESVINADQRKRLGEYYTPDWLAEKVVIDTVTSPLQTRVLDPACGSGTFLFHAVRHHLTAAYAAGMSTPDALKSACVNVIGVDVHPVAVALARVTYLLALDLDGALSHAERPALAVPVYLGDSLQWSRYNDGQLFSSEVLRISTRTTTDLVADGVLPLDEFGEADLRFPESLLNNAANFDQLINALANLTTDNRAHGSVPGLSGVFRRFAITGDQQPIVIATFKRMCELHDQGRNHIWGYYIRNLVRPVWLGLPDNRVDALVGNPPWLSYRYMTPAMQEAFKTLSTQHGMWAGAAVATNQDLSALFVARTVELYLRIDGRFGFVMPQAVLTRPQYEGFRSGNYAAVNASAATVAFGKPWDLSDVKPAFFPVKSSVIIGTRTALEAARLPSDASRWTGKGVTSSMAWNDAETHVTIDNHQVKVARNAPLSPFHTRFAQGATIVPRMLFYVDRGNTSGRLGAGAGRVPVSSARTRNEKLPWKNLATHTGTVENISMFRVLDGQSLVPFATRDAHDAVLPWNGKRLIEDTDPDLDMFPGLAQWWRTANDIWQANRSSERLTLRDQLDYRSKLTDQLPATGQRVVYSSSGMYLAASRVTDTAAVIDNSLYWAAASTEAEALYLVGVLNADATTTAVRPLQAKGQHNPRHFHKYPWQLPIPDYVPTNELHQRLVELARDAEALVGGLDLPTNRKFEAVRRDVRTALQQSGIASQLDDAVRSLLDLPNPSL
jgi:SAM-dependent methyltransferase